MNSLDLPGRPEDTRVVVQGAGNVGGLGAMLLHREGYRITSISDMYGYIVNERGLDMPAVLNHLREHRTLEGFDGRGLGRVISHLHKSKTTFAAGVALQGEGTVRDLSKGSEQFNDVFLLSAEGQIAYKNAHVPDEPE